MTKTDWYCPSAGQAAHASPARRGRAVLQLKADVEAALKTASAARLRVDRPPDGNVAPQCNATRRGSGGVELASSRDSPLGGTWIGTLRAPRGSPVRREMSSPAAEGRQPHRVSEEVGRATSSKGGKSSALLRVRCSAGPLGLKQPNIVYRSSPHD